MPWLACVLPESARLLRRHVALLSLRGLAAGSGRGAELLGFRRGVLAVGRLVLRIDRTRGPVSGLVEPEGRILVG